MDSELILSIKNITKDFPGVKALNNVSIDFYKGQIHGLVGENGAGKSTLIKIIMGAYQKTSGKSEYYGTGKAIEITDPLMAQKFGLSAVYQDLVNVNQLSVAENIVLGKVPKKHGFVDWEKMNSICRETLDKYDIKIDPKEIVENLTTGQKAMLTIAKLSSTNPKLLIFDEPTALLTTDDSVKLFEIIHKLKDDGVAIIYISHRLEEITAHCDVVTVLKDGHKVTTCPVAEVNEDKLVSLMVGRETDEVMEISHPEPGEEVMRVEGLTREGTFKNISFSLRRGEVLGFFGLIGAGRTECMRAIYGVDPLDSGNIYIQGEKVTIKNSSDAMRAGLGMIPEDRRGQGLALELSVNNNINMIDRKSVGRFGFVSEHKECIRSQKYVTALNIKTPSLDQYVSKLSGGNQQKVVISKVLSIGTDIVIMDEPTVGVDVGAKQEIYSLIEKMIKEGKSIILISSYLPEVMTLSNRIIVMYEGRKTGELNSADWKSVSQNSGEQMIMKLASNLLETRVEE